RYSALRGIGRWSALVQSPAVSTCESRARTARTGDHPESDAIGDRGSRDQTGDGILGTGLSRPLLLRLGEGNVSLAKRHVHPPAILWAHWVARKCARGLYAGGRLRFALVRRTPCEDVMRPTTPGGGPPLLVGRSRERSLLRAQLGAALAGRGGLVILSGEA